MITEYYVFRAANSDELKQQIESKMVEGWTITTIYPIECPLHSPSLGGYPYHMLIMERPGGAIDDANKFHKIKAYLQKELPFTYDALVDDLWAIIRS